MFIVIGMISIYFIFIKNSIKVYTISLNSDNTIISEINSTLLITNKINILSFSKINLKENNTIECTYKWRPTTIGRMLSNEVYIGNLVQNKTGSVSYKIHKLVPKPKEEWIRCENTHEPIISKEMFERVQKSIKVKTYSKKKPQKYSIYNGILKCADCGSNLYRSTHGKGKDAFYYCGTYKRKKGCTKHYVTEKELNDVVLSILNKYILMLCEVENEVNTVLYDAKLQYDSEIKKIRNIELSREIEKYEMLMTEVLNDYKNKILTKEEFDDYSQEYLYILNSLRIELEENKKNTNDININWIEHFKKAKNVNTLSRTIIDEFIDNILIDQNGGINIIFKYKNEYNDALKFLDSYNV